MKCLSCGARGSRKTGRDDIKVEDGTDNRTTSVDTPPAQNVHRRRDYNR